MNPALTAEEWRGAGAAWDDGLTKGETLVNWACAEAQTLGEGDTRHALAALCLHGQPFGFTWADVDELTDAADQDEDMVHIMGGSMAYRSWYRDLADRIAALLPPKEGE